MSNEQSLPQQPGGGVDLAAVLAEIEAEVRAKRASGDLPADLEAELDAAFARIAPIDALSADLGTLISKLEQAATIDTRAPTESASAYVARIKSVIGRAIDWDLRHLASQVSGALLGVTRALSLVQARLEDLEAGSDLALEDLVRRLAEALPGVEESSPGVSQRALEPLADRAGPVLHAECSSGWAVQALRQAGVRCYGVDPAAQAAGALDLRREDLASHLSQLPPATLEGVLLSGCVERWTATRLLGVVDLALTHLVPGAPLVVLSRKPQAWSELAGPLSELAPGRPLGTDAWRMVLGAKGCHTRILAEDESCYALLVGTTRP